jgi:hypothetical protein
MSTARDLLEDFTEDEDDHEQQVFEDLCSVLYQTGRYAHGDVTDKIAINALSRILGERMGRAVGDDKGALLEVIDTVSQFVRDIALEEFDICREERGEGAPLTFRHLN